MESDEQKVKGRAAYEQLSSGIRKWIHRQGWENLKSLQIDAIPNISLQLTAESNSQRDVILTAATAGGKTEAAFLPIFSSLENNLGGGEGFQVLCISPLKALINDQYNRLRTMGESSGVAVHRRHGDVSASEKTKALKNPSGIFLTTPESLEALFVRRGREIGKWFAEIDCIVIDELHVFIGSERGKQLQSLMHRVELATRRIPVRIALSATLGDMDAAAMFLRPGRLMPAIILSDISDSSDLKLQLKGYKVRPPKIKRVPNEGEFFEQLTGLPKIADHLFKHLKGKTNLVFANSRGRVEELASLLRQRCEDTGIPVSFFPHHGNLSKHLRETLEQRLKSDNPTTAVCTSTLELGIDIGSVHTVAQVTPPHGVASLRQRLGRSGRREGEAAILRMYVQEDELTPDSKLYDRLRLNLVQSIAIVELLLQKWYEPERANGLHLSTLVQQLISMIVQHGGANATQLYTALCRNGPFRAVDQDTFTLVLRALGKRSVLQQSTDGTLLLGPEGEKISSHYTFYAAFETDREYSIVHKGRKLGSLPIGTLLKPGDCIVFGGRNWSIQEVDISRMLILVTKSRGGTPIRFGGETGQLHDGIAKMMKRVLSQEHEYIYLDSDAKNLLSEARITFRELDLANKYIIEAEGGIVLLPWIGDAALTTLSLVLNQVGVEAVISHRFIEIKSASVNEVITQLKTLVGCEVPEDSDIVPRDGSLRIAKYHYLLDEESLARDYASLRLNAQTAWKWMRTIRKD